MKKALLGALLLAGAAVTACGDDTLQRMLGGNPPAPTPDFLGEVDVALLSALAKEPNNPASDRAVRLFLDVYREQVRLSTLKPPGGVQSASTEEGSLPQPVIEAVKRTECADGVEEEERARCQLKQEVNLIAEKRRVEIEQQQPYDTESFRCLSDFRMCSASDGQWVCSVYLLICAAERLVPGK